MSPIHFMAPRNKRQRKARTAKEEKVGNVGLQVGEGAGKAERAGRGRESRPRSARALYPQRFHRGGAKLLRFFEVVVVTSR